MNGQLFTIPESTPDELTQARRRYEDAVDAYEAVFCNEGATKEELAEALLVACKARDKYQFIGGCVLTKR
jgi:alkylhydroperoxidase/carboxymuconolactone decarboxylase family protein YurZ